MNKKFSVRDVLSVVIYLVIMIHYTIAFLLGNLDSSSTISLIIMYVISALYLLLMICIHIISKIVFNQCYKKYMDAFNYLKSVHKRRYQLYFSDNKEELDTYSEEIQTYGKNVLNLGNYYLAYKKISKKQVRMIQNIIDKTQELMQKDFVAY